MNVKNALDALLGVLDAGEIEREARASGFVERRSPVNGMAFLLAMMAGPQATRDGTLAELSAFLDAYASISVTPQALDARFNLNAVSFMEACLRKVVSLVSSMSGGAKILNEFRHVYLMDSTNFDVAPGLAELFKGYGGRASKASVRIQFVLDFHSGPVWHELGDVRLADSTSLANLVAKRTLPLDGRSLLLADLGYFHTATIAKMCATPGLNFISKIPYNKEFETEEGMPFNLDARLKKRPDSLDVVVRVGGSLCRLVACRLDEAKVANRIRKANATSARKGKSGRIGERYGRFLHYMVFLTNLSAEYGMEKLYTLYRIRWQIELVFKGWKSILRMDRLKSAKKTRILCEIYGRLIAATLASGLSNLAANRQDHLTLSRFKVTKAYVTFIGKLSKAMMAGRTELNDAILAFLEFAAKRCHKCSAKNKPHIEMNIAQCFNSA